MVLIYDINSLSFCVGLVQNLQALGSRQASWQVPKPRTGIQGGELNPCGPFGGRWVTAVPRLMSLDGYDVYILFKYVYIFYMV